jgi:hypothetical protein
MTAASSKTPALPRYVTANWVAITVRRKMPAKPSAIGISCVPEMSAIA